MADRFGPTTTGAKAKYVRDLLVDARQVINSEKDRDTFLAYVGPEFSDACVAIGESVPPEVEAAADAEAPAAAEEQPVSND